MNIFDELRARIEVFLQAQESFIVSEEFRRSTRGVGDAIEALIVQEFADIADGLVDEEDQRAISLFGGFCCQEVRPTMTS